MEKRKFGTTAEKLSVVGFGGIVVTDETPEDAAKIVSKAIDRGINYFDVAPLYGNAQEILGPALQPYRKNVFLACKTLKRTKKDAQKDLEDSLKKLKTDYFDLYQFHSVTTIKEVEEIMGPGGAIEACEKAREKGMVKYIGFSAHSEEAAIKLIDSYEFSSILFPFNWASWLKNDFGPEVLKKAEEKGMAILALKAMAKRSLDKNEKPEWPKCWYSPIDEFEEASLALRFTLSLPVTAAIPPGYAEFLWWACDIADNFKPVTEQEIKSLKEKSLSLNTIAEVLESA